MPSPPDPGRTAWIDQLNDYGRRITAIENQLRVEQLRVVGAVGQPTFQGGWAQYGGFSTVGFWKDPANTVHLQGLTQGGTVGSDIFILPVGYRPTDRLLYMSYSNAALGRIDILPDGEVLSVAGNTAWMALDGITFRAA